MLRYSPLLFLGILLASVVRAQGVGSVTRYEGTVGKEPVVVFLGHGNGYRGTYYYSRVGQIIALANDTAEIADSISLIELFPGQKSAPEIRLHLNFDSTLTGVWRRGARSVPIDLHPSLPPGSYDFDVFSRDDSATVKLTDSIRPVINTYLEVAAPRTVSIAKSDYYFGRISAYLISSAVLQGHNFLAYSKEWSRTYIDSSTKLMRETLAEDTKDGIDPADEEMAFQYSQSTIFSVRYVGDDIVDLDQDEWSYQGGAHENEALTIHVLDLRERKELTLQDILSGDSGSNVKLLLSELRRRYVNDTEYWNDLFGESIQNFYITPRGIGFHWSAPSVASFVDGPVEYFIPFSRLRGKLTPWFVKRMGLKN